MTARIEIECRDGYIVVDGCEYYDHGDYVLDLVTAIRQQARDIAELRDELRLCCELKREYQEREAAAVAERDELRSEHAPRVTQLFEAIAERDTLRARLAAIDAAPTVATVIGTELRRQLFWECGLDKIPPLGTELIARPAKE